MSATATSVSVEQKVARRPISERSVFILQELLKLRRLSRPQFAQLCRIDGAPTRLKMPLSRLREKSLVSIDYMPIGKKSEPILALTETGHRQAATSLGRDHDSHYRDYVKVDFMAHLLMGTDLYLQIVAQNAPDWMTVRQNASAFEWHSSNDDTTFLWDAPAEFKGERKQRRVVPDVTIETDKTRYLIEIERSTKTQKVVGRKVEQYCHLFSPLRSVQEQTGYASKYPDAKNGVVVFVFLDERRAANARQHFERRAKSQGFYIPAWKCGTVESIGAELRRELLGSMSPSRAKQPAATSANDIIERYRDSIRQYVIDTTKQILTIEKLVTENKPVPMPERPASLRHMRDLLRELQVPGGSL